MTLSRVATNFLQVTCRHRFLKHSTHLGLFFQKTKPQMGKTKSRKSIRSYSGWWVRVDTLQGTHLTTTRSITCRHRKLKCDEVRPICRNCIKSSRECCYVERAIFRTFDTNILASGKTKDGTESRQLFDDDQRWLSIPKDCTTTLGFTLY